MPEMCEVLHTRSVLTFRLPSEHYQRDAEPDGAPEHHPGRLGIAGATPYAWSTQPHGAQANSGHGQVPTDREECTKTQRCLPDVALRLGTHAFLR
jgi:hypothetical protein